MPAAAPEASQSLWLADENATARLGEDIAAVLRPGDLVALSGGLGAGKTSFARALIRALAADPSLEAPSPTFPIRIDHTLPRLNVTHADLYRISSPDELEEIGLEEALSDTALLVEWPERLPFTAEDRLDVELAIEAGGRRAELAGSGSWPARLARTQAIRAFLDASGRTGAIRVPLVGDASTRAYERIAGRQRSSTAILMNAPARAEAPAQGGGRSYDALAHRALDVRPFVAIGTALRRAGVHAPEILAADMPAGLVLVEDLGSEGLLDQQGAPILERYEAAIDLLAFMHGRPWPTEAPLPDGSAWRLPRYDRDALLVEVGLFPDWFGGHGGEPAFPPDARGDFLAAWSQALASIEGGPETWVLRDFHSPNLIWRPAAAGLARLGVIDFQDALIGDPAYDVASLAQDARAPLDEGQERELRARYVAARADADPSFDPKRFDRAYHVLAAQRATKVLGAFTRLALAEGKPGYQRHRERLKSLLRRSLAHPDLAALQHWYAPFL